MKRSLLILLGTLCFSFFAEANIAGTKSAAASWLSNQTNKGFLENRGQMTDMKGNLVPHVLFKTEAPELNFWITEQGITIQTLKLRKELVPENELSELDKQEALINNKPKTKKITEWERIDIELKGASIKKENIVKGNPLQGHNNYFFSHCPDGIYEVKEYEKITIQDVYPNIDWVFYRKADGTLKYDFIVHPGADYKTIELLYKSKTPISINESGELELYTKHGNVKENTPVSFYNEQTVPTQFKLNYQQPITIHGDGGYETSISFNLTLPPLGGAGGGLLIIDPQLTWATFYGGNAADGPMSVDTDNNGNVFITGYAYAGGNTNFPLLDAGTYFQGGNVAGMHTFILKFNNVGVRLWATFYGEKDSDNSSVTTDALGNIFVVGSTRSTTFPTQNAGTYYDGTNPGGAVKAFILKFNNTGTRLWATLYGANSGNAVSPYCVTTDAAGNIFVTGATYGTNFPTLNTGTYHQVSSTAPANSSDAFILKFSNTGVRLWATVYGGSKAETGFSITCDPTGNVFVAGTTYSTDLPIQNAGTFYQATNAGTGYDDLFIAKFSNTGTHLWATYYGGALREMMGSVAADGNGNIFVMGYTSSVDFPTQNAGTYFDGTLGGTADVFIIKFDNVGNRLWATYYGGNDGDYTGSWDNIAVDGCGTVYIGFQTNSVDVTTQVSCDGGYLDNSFNGQRDQFIARFSNYGTLLWATYLGGNKDEFRTPLALDNEGNLFVSGEWSIGPGVAAVNPAAYPLTNPGGGAYYMPSYNGGVDDGMIAKFNKTSLTLNPSKTDTTCSCDGTATVVATGGCAPLEYNWYNSTWVNIGTGANIANLCPGNYSVIVNDTINCSIDTAYVTIASAPGGAVNTIVNANICTGGNYTLPDGSVVNTTGVYTHTFVTASGCDSIITTNLTMGNPLVTTATITVCAGQSALVHGSNESVAGVYSQTFVATGGCDSISSIALTVNPVVSNTLTVSACNSYTHNAIVYNTSGIYTQTLLSTAGCDSLLTIDLTINNSVTTADNFTICSGQSASIHGTPQTTAGVYTQTFVGVNGCDSVATVTLTVNAIITNTITASACNSYTHNAQAYTASGIYTQTLVSAGGCDSVLTIELTINTPTISSNTVTVCAGQPALIHGVTQNTAGIYTQTYTASNGCDSASTITLSVIPPASNTVNVNTCGSYTHNAATYTSSGIYTQTLIANSGCDSVLTIQLAIDTIQTNDTVFVCEGEGVVIHSLVRFSAGTYSQVFTAVNGCDSVSSVVLILYPPPTAAFQINPNPVQNQLPVQFINQSNQATTWMWSFGDILNSSSTQQQPSFIYPESGNYEIQLVVNNVYGCADTTSQQLIVEQDFVLYAPNTFSPNGDHVNDVFLPKGDGIDTEEFEFYIFDRWGNEIFKSTHLAVGWDGRANNGKAIAQIDTYVWLVKLKDINGKAHRFIGHVNLIR